MSRLPYDLRLENKANKEHVMENYEALDTALDREAALSKQFSVNYSTTNYSTLTLGIYGGQLQGGDGPIVVANQTLALSANATNYVEQNWSTGEITKNTSGFTAGRRSLFVIVCGPSSITAITDRRGAAGGSAAVADASDSVKGVVKLATAPEEAGAPIAVGDNDPRLSDARTPTAHAESHASGGDDEITPEDIGAAASEDLDAHTEAAAPHTGHLNTDGSNSPSADIDLAGYVFKNAGLPVDPTDVATKEYVEAFSNGLTIKQSVKAASTGNLTLSGEQMVDGVSCGTGDRVLVKNQITQSENGIYVVGTPWVRASDADSDAEMSAGTMVFVEYGTDNKQTRWAMITPGITLDTDPCVWTKESGVNGEVNTASNVGTEGVGFFEGKLGVNLAFRNIVSKSTAVLAFAYNATTKCIEGTINAAGIAINALDGVLGVLKGGTGLSSIPKGSIIYASDDNELSALEPDSDGVQRFIAQTGDGAPVRTTVSAPGYLATSNSSITTELTSQSFTTQAGTAYVTGDRVRLISILSAAVWVEGVITAYDGTAMTVLADRSSVPVEDGVQLISGGFKLSLAGEPAVPFPPQNAARFYAGPVDGDAAEPEFRAIEETDIPAEIARDAELQAHVEDDTNPHGVTAAQVGLDQVDNTSDLDKPVSTAQQAAIDAAIVGLYDPKGPIDCSANPNYPAALKGDNYVVSVSGKIGGGSGPAVEAGDVVIAFADNAGGTHASVGSSWVIVQRNITNPMTLALGGTGADLSLTGGANQLVRQNSAGGAFTVAALTNADLPASGAAAGSYGGSYTIPTFTVNAQGVLTTASGALPMGVRRTVTQTSHGLSVGDYIKLTGSNTYGKAQADSEANASVVGIVYSVTNANTFNFVTPGSFIDTLSGLTAGTLYYLSPTTAGAHVSSDPAPTNLSRPVLYAITSSIGLVVAYKPRTLTAGEIPDVRPARDTVQVTTASIADDATDDVSITLGKAGFIYIVQTDKAARVRLYTTAAARTADASRDGSTSPDSGDGVMMEVTTDASHLTITRDRPLPFYDIDGTLNGSLPMAVTNLSGSTGTVTVTITRLSMER